MKYLKALVGAVALAAASTAFAHGEDQPGPHNGFVRMPGSYHVEVIPGKNTVDIMLLDMNFKNPTVLNSHVKVKIKTPRNTYVLRCESMDNYFSCPVSETLLTYNGTLLIKSKRLFEDGMQVEYPLPLRFTENKIS